MESFAVIYPVLVILSVLRVGTSLVTCPALCTCNSREVWCENKGLTAIPIGIPVDTRKLYLFDNNITTIPEGSLSRLKDLQMLVLTSNGLTNDAIRPGLFRQMKKLEALMMSDNKLTRITNSMFAGMPNLMRLYVERNRIRGIEQKALFNLTKLVEIKLGGNQLTNFPKITICPKLRRLSLPNNRLVRLQFDSLSEVNLEELELSNNRLTQLPSTTFGDMSNFGVLDLSLNRIRRLPRIIKNMSSLHTLNLSSNSISQLPADLLQSLRKIKVLDLHGLRLTSLSASFIPRGVLFNVADFSRNPWLCDCELSWLPKIMRAIPGAFINLDSVRCASPARWQQRKLVSLYDRDLNCHSVPDLPIPDKNNVGATAQGKPTVDLCDGISCANGSPCYINKTTNRPACRCPRQWTGMLCDQLKVVTTTSTSATTTTTKGGDSPKGGTPQLVIRTDTLTANSVGIILPSTGRELKVSVAELKGGRKLSPRQYTIIPTTHPYTVEDLEPGKRYNICITSTDIIRNMRGQNKIVEDTLCGTVTTDSLPAPGTTNGVVENYNYDDDATEPKHVIPPPTAEDPSLPNQSVQQTGVTGNSVDDSNDFPLLYPALGAGLGAFVILVVAILFFVCYRNKKKIKHTGNNNDMKPMEYSRGRPSDGTIEAEMVPMVTQQHIALKQQANTTIATQQGELYQQNPHNYTQSCAHPPQRVATPNKNGSLGRSSNSGGSVCGGTQISQPGEVQRGYSPGSNIGHTMSKDPLEEARYVPTPNGAIAYQGNGGVYTTQIPYTTTQPLHSNRGHEFLYRAHPSSLAAETIAETRYEDTLGLTVPRPTCTTVNHFHHSPIAAATTIGPEYGYQHHANGLVNGYNQQTVPQLTRSPVRYTPAAQMVGGMRYPADQRIGLDRYGPAITSSHMIDSCMAPVFHDTLVM